MGYNKQKKKMSIELEANVDIEVEVEAEVEVEVEIEAEAEVEVELDAGLEVEIEVPQEEAVVEIEVDIEAPELAVEGELVLEVNVEENLVAVDEQGGSVDLSAHSTMKMVWLIVMIVCIVDLCIAIPYTGWAIYACIAVSSNSGFNGATVASCWITLILVAIFCAIGVVVLLISMKQLKKAKEGEALEGGPHTVVTYEQAPVMGEVGGNVELELEVGCDVEVELEVAADVEVEIDCEAGVEIELEAPEVEIELEAEVEVEVEVEAEVEVEIEVEA